MNLDGRADLGTVIEQTVVGLWRARRAVRLLMAVDAETGISVATR